MTILPIAERELRAAARKQAMVRVRLAATVICAVAAIGSLVLGGNRSGAGLFHFLTAYAFVFALVTGALVAADCLSEEKRMGTLGLLFLTNLRGYDVVLGKFVARALGPAYGLGAIVPVMAVSFAMGGVTGWEFWRVAVALMNTLFLSLAVGIGVSAWSRESQRAVVATIGWMLAILAPHGLTWVPGLGQFPGGWEFLAWFSPAFTFEQAYDAQYAARPAVFWYSLCLANGMGWLLLAAASRTIQRAWQDKPARPRLERTIARASPRIRGLVEDQPLRWLLRGGKGLTILIWSIASLWAVGATVAIIFSAKDRRDLYWGMTFVGSKLVGFVLKTIFVVVACRFFTEARRSGLLEVLMCAPLKDAEIIRAQWRNLWRLFAGPLGLFCAPLILRSAVGWDVMDGRADMISALTGYGCGALLAANTLTDFLALGWVGMWFSASLRTPGLAPGLAVLVVLLLPSILICVPAFVANVLFVVWARERLFSDFRRVISEQFSGVAATT